MSPDTLWYFAFGSNMNSRVFLGRRKMHPRSVEPAELRGYALVFDHPGMPILEPAFANVKPAEGETVFGVLYHMNRHEMELLDKMEGGGAYQNLELEVVGTTSGPTVAHVFWTPNTGIEHLRPSRRYMSVLIEGAQEHNLPDKWIRFLKNQPTSPYYLLLSPAMKGVMPLLNKLFRLGLGVPFRGWKERQHRKAHIYNLRK